MLARTGNMSVTVIVGQIRSTAVDILRSSGMSYREAADAVRRPRRGRPRKRTGAVAAPDLSQPGWQAGHQYVVRPPIVSRASAVPQRGQ